MSSNIIEFIKFYNHRLPCVMALAIYAAVLELPLVNIVSHYLFLQAIVCPMQSCWSMWRTLGHCHHHCQTLIHLQDNTEV